MEAAQILDRVVARFIGREPHSTVLRVRILIFSSFDFCPSFLCSGVPGLSALSVFDSHVAKFTEILIERGNRGVSGSCSRGEQAVHEMNLRLSIAV
jgi:hypothetical protein